MPAIDLGPMCEAAKQLQEQAFKMLFGKKVTLLLEQKDEYNGRVGIIDGVILDPRHGLTALVMVLKKNPKHARDFLNDKPGSRLYRPFSQCVLHD